MFHLIVCSSADLKWLKHNLSSMTANVTLCHVFIYFTKTKSKCKKTSTRPDSVALETPLTALIWGFLTSFIHSFHHGRGSQFMWSVWVPKRCSVLRTNDFGLTLRFDSCGLLRLLLCCHVFREKSRFTVHCFCCCCFWKFLQEWCSLNFVRRMNIFL